MTFLPAPPSSHPTTSTLVYTRNVPPMHAFWIATARSWSVHATTVAAGSPWAMGTARFGPDTTTTCCCGTPVTSTMTSLIRLSVPSSTPLARLTSGTPSGIRSRQRIRFSRNDWLGTASTTACAPASASSGSAVAASRSGSRRFSRYAEVVWRSLISSATSRRRAHNTTSRPASASTLANVVPHEPAPRTAMRCGTGSATGALAVRLGVLARRRRRLFTAQCAEQPGDLRHHHVGHLAVQLRRGLLPPERGQIDRLADQVAHRLAGEQPHLAVVQVEHVPGAPPRDRDDRHVVGERQFGHTRIGVLRPALRVLGDGAFRIDDDHLALAQRLMGVPQRIARLLRPAVDGD